MDINYIERPSGKDSEEDLLKYQEEFLQRRSLAGNTKTSLSVKVKKMSEKSARKTKKADVNSKVSTMSENTVRNNQKGKIIDGSRFTLTLDALEEESRQVVFPIQEKNFDEGCSESCSDPVHPIFDKYSKADGFPEIMDLSQYYMKSDCDPGPTCSDDKRSFFAREFDRLNGEFEANDSILQEKIDAPVSEDLSSNDERIMRMSKEEYDKALKEISERLDPKTISFLQARGKDKVTPNKANEATKKISKFKRDRQTNKVPSSNFTENSDMKKTNPAVEEAIKNMEIIGGNVDKFLHQEKDTRERHMLPDEYSRLAVDAVQLDFANKCLRTLFPRQVGNVIRLFDGLLTPPSDYDGKDKLLEEARTRLPAIKGLYLEQQTADNGEKNYVFASGINPSAGGSWTLVPIRKVLDAYQKDGKVAISDVIVVRLSLLWTVLLMTERTSFFYTLADPGEFYVRLAELYLLGPEIFMDDCIHDCFTRVMEKYLIPEACKGRLLLSVHSPIAELDAFLPFYEELLRSYEQCSVGNDDFALTVLMGAHLNASLSNRVLMELIMWTPDRNVVRQITTATSKGAFILETMRRKESEDFRLLEMECFEQYSHLLAMYAAAIRNEAVTRDRNPLVYEIAAQQLKMFIARHTKQGGAEFDALAGIIKASVTGKLNF